MLYLCIKIYIYKFILNFYCLQVMLTTKELLIVSKWIKNNKQYFNVRLYWTKYFYKSDYQKISVQCFALSIALKSMFSYEYTNERNDEYLEILKWQHEYKIETS